MTHWSAWYQFVEDELASIAHERMVQFIATVDGKETVFQVFAHEGMLPVFEKKRIGSLMKNSDGLPDYIVRQVLAYRYELTPVEIALSNLALMPNSYSLDGASQADQINARRRVNE